MADKKKRQGLGCLIFFLLPFMLSGLGMLFFLGQVTTLQCTHIEPFQLECVKETTWMGLIPLEKETLDDVRGAQVDSSRGGKGGSTYCVQLTRRQGGVVPLTAVYSSGAEAKEKVAARINAYAKDGEGETLKVRMGIEWIGLVMGVIFTLVGIVPVIMIIKIKQ